MTVSDILDASDLIWEQDPSGSEALDDAWKRLLGSSRDELRPTLVVENDESVASVYASGAVAVVARYGESIRIRRVSIPSLPPGVLPRVVPPLPPGIPPLPPGVEPTFSVAPSATDDFSWTPEQLRALDEIEEWFDGDARFFALTGPAGSGKTSLLREVVDRHPEMILTAMTGKAALRLSQVVGRGASTLHSRLYWPPAPGTMEFNRLRRPPSRCVAVDEAGMMGPRVKEHLGEWGFGMKILMTGDTFQLPPVITGRDLQEYGKSYSVFSTVPGAHLDTVMRNAGGVLRAATHVRRTGELCEASDLDAPGRGYEFRRERDALECAVDMYVEDRDDCLICTWRNSERMRANRLVRERLGHEGPLPDEGEPVLIKKNTTEYLNGEIVECGGFEVGPKLEGLRTFWMKVGKGGESRILVTVDGGSKDRGGEFFDGQQPWIKDWKKYHIALAKEKVPEPVPVSWGYVLSGHAAQGSQYRRSIVFLDRGDLRSQHFRKMTALPDGTEARFSARWCYTAQTRSTKHTVMVVGR